MIVFMGAIAAALTYTMFHSKNMMLGFPSAIFWALTGWQAYTISTTAWDFYSTLGFACIAGMTVFSFTAMYALRTKKEDIESGDEYIDEGEEPEVFIDEGGKDETAQVKGESRRVNRIRDNAERRRVKRKEGIRDKWA